MVGQASQNDSCRRQANLSKSNHNTSAELIANITSTKIRLKMIPNKVCVWIAIISIMCAALVTRTKSNKPPEKGLDTNLLPTRPISDAPLLQECEHCRPPTLPCAASFLHQSATHPGPLHWSKTPSPPPSCETCNSTVVDLPLSKIG